MLFGEQTGCPADHCVVGQAVLGACLSEEYPHTQCLDVPSWPFSHYRTKLQFGAASMLGSGSCKISSASLCVLHMPVTGSVCHTKVVGA